MLLSPIVKILPEAVAIALSPTPMIVVILILLFSGRPRRAGGAYVLGWVLSMLAAVYLLSSVGQAVRALPKPPAPAWFWRVFLLLGLLLVAWAVIEMFRPSQKGEQAHLPSWAGMLNTVGPGKSFLLGMVMAGFSPKNLIMALGAVLAVQQAEVRNPTYNICLLIFVFCASVLVAMPPAYYLLAGKSAEKRLVVWKDWLLANSRAIILVIGLMVGLKMIGNALSGLGW
jgi:hypothetical protein